MNVTNLCANGDARMQGRNVNESSKTPLQPPPETNSIINLLPRPKKTGTLRVMMLGGLVVRRGGGDGLYKVNFVCFAAKRREKKRMLCCDIVNVQFRVGFVIDCDERENGPAWLEMGRV